MSSLRAPCLKNLTGQNTVVNPQIKRCGVQQSAEAFVLVEEAVAVANAFALDLLQLDQLVALRLLQHEQAVLVVDDQGRERNAQLRAQLAQRFAVVVGLLEDRRLHAVLFGQLQVDESNEANTARPTISSSEW